MSNYSIYIPRVFNNIPNQKIVDSFERYDIGTISSIDVKRKTGLDGSCYKVVFIHFSYWNEYNSAAINLRERIENPDKEARLIYDDPWYWILLPNTSEWKQEDVYQPQMSIRACYDRIYHVVDELTNIYRELLHKKSYIPVNYSDCVESNDIESCSPSSASSSVAPSNMSPMTIDELMVEQDGQLHKPPTPPLNSDLSKIHCEYEYDFELDLDSGCSMSVIDYDSCSTIESKHWMTVNFCGNE
jgi:hypothetical protein